MDLRPTIHSPTYLPSVSQPLWGYHLARWISILFSPPLVATLATLIAAAITPQDMTWYGARIMILWMVLFPISYLGFLYNTGKIIDLDVYHRTQRFRPYLFSLICILIAVIILVEGNAPLILIVLSVAVQIETVGLFMLNFLWKISAHTAAIAGFSTFFCLTVGSGAIPILLLIPLVAWSRVHLRRHTLAQTIVGGAWGATSFLLTFIYFPLLG